MVIRLMSAIWRLAVHVVIVLAAAAVPLGAQPASSPGDPPSVGPRRVVSANPFGLLFEFFNAEYERKVSDSLSARTGGSFFKDKGEVCVNADLFVRYYPSGRPLDGWAFGVKAGATNVERATYFGVGVDVNWSRLRGKHDNFHVGIGFGLKRLFGTGPEAHMARLAYTMAAFGLLMTVCGWPVAASTQSRAGTVQGYALAYDLQFGAAHATLAAAVSADRTDPAPRRAIAAVIWMEILFMQGITTFEAFTGEIAQSDVVWPVVPVALATRFARALAEARELADRQVAASDDADAHYQVGATALLAAVYGATVEGRTIASFTQGRRAVAEMGRARALAPSMREAALALGMSQYTIATLS